MVSPDYEAIVTDRFKDDLTAEVIWRLENAGQSSAERLIRSYETAFSAVEASPHFMPSIRGHDVRWVAVEKHVAIYEIDESRKRVTLLRLLNMASDWKSELLHSIDEN